MVVCGWAWMVWWACGMAEGLDGMCGSKYCDVMQVVLRSRVGFDQVSRGLFVYETEGWGHDLPILYSRIDLGLIVPLAWASLNLFRESFASRC